MKYLFDIGHPAHVHYSKNCIRILESQGHEPKTNVRHWFVHGNILLIGKKSLFQKKGGTERASLLYIQILGTPYLILSGRIEGTKIKYTQFLYKVKQFE